MSADHHPPITKWRGRENRVRERGNGENRGGEGKGRGEGKRGRREEWGGGGLAVPPRASHQLGPSIFLLYMHATLVRPPTIYTSSTLYPQTCRASWCARQVFTHCTLSLPSCPSPAQPSSAPFFHAAPARGVASSRMLTFRVTLRVASAAIRRLRIFNETLRGEVGSGCARSAARTVLCGVYIERRCCAGCA